MDEATINHLTRISHETSSHVLRPFTVAIITPDTGEENVFSGTIIRVGKRLLIATAAHPVRNADVSLLRPYAPSVKNRQDKQSIFKSLKFHASLDICCLEVDSQFEESYFGNSFCHLDNIACYGVGRKDKPLLVIGTPSCFTKLAKLSMDKSRLQATQLTYLTKVIEEKECPDFVPEHFKASDPATDIFLQYPKGTGKTFKVASDEAIELPIPRGISGGGLWDLDFNLSELWSPHSAKLIGIQTDWYEETECLRAVQIKHWLRLVYEHFCDLREILIARFGAELFR